jgi:hypothetical protein
MRYALMIVLPALLFGADSLQKQLIHLMNSTLGKPEADIVAGFPGGKKTRSSSGHPFGSGKATQCSYRTRTASITDSSDDKSRRSWREQNDRLRGWNRCDENRTRHGANRDCHLG